MMLGRRASASGDWAGKHEAEAASAKAAKGAANVCKVGGTE